MLRNLKFADEDRPLLGFVWPMMLNLHRKATALLLPSVGAYGGIMPLAERKKFCDLIMQRWVYLHRPVHSAAYALNPRFHGADHFADPEVRDDFASVLRDMLANDEEVGAALAEYHAYHKKDGQWADPIIWAEATRMEPCYFWSTYGTNTIYLDRVAPQLLGAQHAAGGSERNWSLQGRINGRDRGRQSTAVLARMTRLAWNQNLVDRRRQRAARRTAAIQRVNARNGARAVPARPAPKPYPLQDNEEWESCDESESSGDDADRVHGPQIAVPALRGRQIIRP